MNITSLEQMEKIVSRNKMLSWRGWDVVFSKAYPGAWSNKNGAFVKGVWYSQDIFEVGSNGWEIPNKLVR
jgi:hypothetical protein